MSTASHAPDRAARPHRSAASQMGSVAERTAVEAAAESLKHSPRGALVVASISVGLLFIGWLAFYFLLFMPRGSID
jgi:hypothetical protein